MKKRLLCTFLSLTIIFALFSANTVFADTVWHTETADLIQDGKIPSASADVSIKKYAGNIAALETAIYSTLLSGATTPLYTSSYSVSLAEVKDTFQSIMNSHPEFFYVSPSFRYSSKNGYVQAVLFSYLYSGATLSAMKSEYDDAVEYISSLAPSSFSDLEKALFFHDYFCVNYEYDMRLFANQGVANYDAYSFFTEKTGVCQSYTLAYMAILKNVGVNVSFAASNSMNHIWNVVEINGNWYHVDVTHDDPALNKTARACHDNFLRSSEGIISTGHYGWESYYVCSDTSYDSYFWTDIDSSLAYSNGHWYCIKNSVLYQADDINSNQTLISKKSFDNDYWLVWNTSQYAYNIKFAYVGAIGDYVYYNTATAFYAYNTQNGAISEYYRPDCSNGYIYSFFVTDGEITYMLAKDPYEKDRAVYRHNVSTGVNTPMYYLIYCANADGYDTGYDIERIYPDGTTLTVMNGIYSIPDYTFSGWNTSPDGDGVSYAVGDTVTLNDNLTLYANWIPDTVYYTITYHANGGVGEMEQTVGEIPVVADCEFTRESYDFSCWNTLSDGSGVSYSAGDTVNGDIDLYAQWVLVPISLAYESEYVLDAQNKIIHGISPDTLYEDFIDNFSEAVTVLDENGGAVTAGQKIATGMKIVKYSGNDIVDFYDIVIFGDVDGDGAINVNDIVAIRSFIGLDNISGIKLYAANADRDDKNDVNVNDIVAIRSNIGGMEISQD